MRYAAVILVWLATFGPAIWLVMVLTRECGSSLALWTVPLLGVLGALGYALYAAHHRGGWLVLRIALAFLLALGLLWAMRRICSDRWWEDAGPLLRWFRNI